MRVLQLISTIGYYGAENVVSNLTRELHGRGIGVAVCSLTSSRQRSTTLLKNAHQSGIAALEICCAGRFEWQAVRSLRRFIREQNISIIHTHNYKANFYAMLASRGLRTKLLATCHNWTNSTRSLRVYAALDRVMLRSFRRVVAVSEPVALALTKVGIPARRIARIANGVDVNYFQNKISASSANERPVVVGTACRLVEEKGIADLLYAAREILIKHSNVHVLIAGEGPSRADFERLCDELGISSKVTFSGFCNDMRQTYAAMDIFVLASHREGMPMSVLEAMAAGKPVIATRVGALPDAITDETGLLIAPGDRMGLQEALRTLIENADMRLNMGRRSAARVRESFSVATMADSYLRIYQELCETDAPESSHATPQAAVSK